MSSNGISVVYAFLEQPTCRRRRGRIHRNQTNAHHFIVLMFGHMAVVDKAVLVAPAGIEGEVPVLRLRIDRQIARRIPHGDPGHLTGQGQYRILPAGFLGAGR